MLEFRLIMNTSLKNIDQDFSTRDFKFKFQGQVHGKEVLKEPSLTLMVTGSAILEAIK